MRCQSCGRESDEGSRVCPWCGTQLSPEASSKGSRKKGIGKVTVSVIAVLAIMLAAAAVIVVSDLGNDTQSGRDGTDPVEPTPTPEVPGDETDTTMKTTFTASGKDAKLFTITEETAEDGSVSLRFDLDADAASGYTKYIWYVYNVNNPSEHAGADRTVPYLTWSLDSSTNGDYRVGVYCFTADEGGDYNYWERTTYELDIRIDGTVTKNYVWIYDGSYYRMTISFPYSDYASYAGNAGASIFIRSPSSTSDYDNISRFIVVDDTIESMERELSELFSEKYGAAGGQDYAEFILAFVQCCFDYSTDFRLYGHSEYFAFPLETIYNGTGDCEDTSALCASLFEAAGYDSGVFIIPGHAIAAVSIDGFTAGNVSPTYSQLVSQFSYVSGTETYYGCETTLDSNRYGVGWISNDYSVVDGKIHYKGEALGDDYTLYKPLASA